MKPEVKDGALRVEVLYPEFGYQGGANGNELYLRACLPGAEFVDTEGDDEPAFSRGDVSLVVMGGMSEVQVELVIERLRPYRDRLEELVEAGVPMFFCGNAGEVLCRKIVHADGTEVTGLGILDGVARQMTPRRFNDIFAGVFEPGEGAAPIKLGGFKSQFTQIESGPGAQALCSVAAGYGHALGSAGEGFRRGNLIATWMLGPVLAENPPLTRWLLDTAGMAACPLAFEDVAMAAYDLRMADMFKPGMRRA